MNMQLQDGRWKDVFCGKESRLIHEQCNYNVGYFGGAKRDFNCTVHRSGIVGKD